MGKGGSWAKGGVKEARGLEGGFVGKGGLRRGGEGSLEGLRRGGGLERGGLWAPRAFA